MRLAHIAAVARNGVIGAGNDLPWDIPEDMAFFREKTKGRLLIMGRKTFESVGHPLPHRMNIVITRQKDFTSTGKNVSIQPDLQRAIEFAREHTSTYGDEVFIIGGGQIFKESLPLVDIIYLTRIDAEFPGDVHYPDLKPNDFELVESRERPGPPPFTFHTYIRR
jgi:dihydrofolate reductase